MKVKPLFDRVLLKQCKQSENTPSKIILPPTSQQKENLATVVAVGNGVMENGKLEPMIVGVGDVVLYTKYAGSSVKIDEEDFIIIKQTDILAIIDM